MGAELPTPKWVDYADDGTGPTPDWAEEGETTLPTSPNTNSDDISRNAGATALNNPPISITGLLTDHANQPVGPLPSYSVIDATGDADNAANPAGGYAQAIGWTKDMVAGGHTSAAWLTRAAGAAKDDPMVAGLGTLNKIYAVPFGVAAAVANTNTDLQNGASKGDALVGNAMRGTVVTGAGMIP